MSKVIINRHNAQITTSLLRCTWSILTGALESLVFIPDNFEWIGKGDINVQFTFDTHSKEINLLNDIEISEAYDELSSGIQITLYWDRYRIKSIYKSIAQSPALFNYTYILIQDDFISEYSYIPFRIHLNSMINTIKKGVLLSNEEVAFIETDTGQGLLFYVKNGISIDVSLSNRKLMIVEVGARGKLSGTEQQTITLPTSYILPYDKFETTNLELLHNQVISKLHRYETYLKQKDQ